MNTNTHVSTREEVLTKDVIVNILVVNHSPEDFTLLEVILKKEGRKIIPVSSFKEVVKISQEHSIALILLDVHSTEINVFEEVQKLKNNPKTKDINIIFITAQNEKFTLQRFEEGSVDLLQKPLDINITQAKVAVFEKLYLQQEALREQAEKLAVINKQLDEFVYIVSHDLKAPLRGISSLANFIADDLGSNLNDGMAETLKMLQSRCNRMQSLIDGILHYSRMSNNNGPVEQVDINDLLKEILELIVVPANIKITIQDNMPVVKGEKIKLHEIFQNLISNGIKYNDKGQGTVIVNCQDIGNWYEFSVADNGAGIKEDHHEKIFGIFQTLQPKDKVESTGIGLTIVKKLVERNGGKITVESVPNEGSTFKFTWKK